MVVYSIISFVNELEGCILYLALFSILLALFFGLFC